MTVAQYVNAKLARFRVPMSDDELQVLLEEHGLNATDMFTPILGTAVKTAIVSVIPELLIAPSISQGDYSIKFDVAGIKAYYSLLCRELGLPDLVNVSGDIVQDKSYLW